MLTPCMIDFCVHLQGYTIPKGDMLMVSPYWAHRNEKYFKDSASFIPVSIARVLELKMCVSYTL